MTVKSLRRLLIAAWLIFLTMVASGCDSTVYAQGATHCGTLAGNETWLAGDNVHVVTCDVIIPAGVTLTIEAGAIVKFQKFTQINVNGKLVVQGTTSNLIYFTSYFDDTIGGDTDGTPTAGAVGDWGNIQFNSGSDDASLITRAVVSYSGNDGGGLNDGAIRLNNASPDLSYITFTNNYINAVQIRGNTSWQTDTWDNTTLVYVVEGGDLTIPAANTLTINPGMQVKLTSFRSINVNGKLVVPGTSGNLVYFSFLSGRHALWAWG